MRKGSLFFLFFYLVLAVGPLWADQTIRLRVSATIPPRPCEFPNSCGPLPVNTETKVVVDDGKIRYVGLPPRVSKKDDLVTIIF